MGKPAIPFILQELIANGGNWFWALTAITGENPVDPNDLGQTKKMKEAWQQWGLANTTSNWPFSTECLLTGM
jgi:hypothetical protein